MPETKELNGSVFETLHTHSETLKVHATEISMLKKSDEDLMRELKGMKSDFTNLENTIWKTAQSTQDHFSVQNAQQWKFIETLNSANQEEKARKHEITKTKLDKFWEFAGKLIVILLGSGGFFYVLLEMASK